MSKYRVKYICPVHKTAFCICYNCCTELFCLEGIKYCPMCDITKFITPKYLQQTYREILNEYLE